MGLGTDEALCPDLERYSLWSIHPYLLERPPSTSRSITSFHLDIARVFENPPKGWQLRQLKQVGLDRWFIREVRALFRSEPGDEKDEPGEPREPKIQWLELSQEGMEQTEGRVLKPELLSQASIGVLRMTKDGPVVEVIARSRMTVSALVSKAGMLLVLFELQASRTKKRRALSLAQAMRINYLAAHADVGHRRLSPGEQQLLVLPHAIASKLRQRVRDLGESETRVQGRFPEAEGQVAVPIEPEHLEQCYGLTVHNLEITFTGSASLELPSLHMTVRDAFMSRLPDCKPYLGFRGRLPVATHIVLPWDERLQGPEADARAAAADLEEVESAAARCMRHPAGSGIAPPLASQPQREEFQTIPFGPLRRIHVSSEAFVAFTVSQTEFERNAWDSRIGSEYLTTYLLALHQAMFCQNLSWLSYFEALQENRRNNEELVRLFEEYTTQYDFSVVSNQLAIQGLYRAARSTLGVEKLVPELREELRAWLDSELRNEQRSLNSIAVVVLLLSLATVFINLNLTVFSKDAWIDAWPESFGLAALEALWLWVPTLLVVFVSISSSKIREHFARVIQLLFGRRK